MSIILWIILSIIAILFIFATGFVCGMFAVFYIMDKLNPDMFKQFAAMVNSHVASNKNKTEI